LKPGAQQLLFSLDQALVPLLFDNSHTRRSIPLYNDIIFQQGSIHGLPEALLYVA
jgi:hypothetical protein